MVSQLPKKKNHKSITSDVDDHTGKLPVRRKSQNRYIPSILILAAAYANLQMNLYPLELFKIHLSFGLLKKQTVKSAQF